MFADMSHKFYDVLGISRSASKDEIKRAFKKKAMTCHPDKGGDPDTFKELGEAYEVLSDDEKRARYDQLGDEGFSAQGGGGPEMDPFGAASIFEQMFGGGGMPFAFDPFGGMAGQQRGPHKCNDHLHGVRLTLADAFTGINKTVRVNITKQCSKCRESCHVCQGRGTITDMRRMGFMTQVSTRPCDKCQGSGFQVAAKAGCQECKGTGSSTVEHKLEINFPPGVANKHRVVFKGMGEQPTRPDDVPGNLIFEVTILPDAHFQREGNDLIYKTQVTLRESLTGKDIVIPHFGGDITVNTFDMWGVIKEGQTYSLPKKGIIPSGNLNILFTVNYPSGKKMSQEDRESLHSILRKLEI
jgi:DnaJ homolog subfamily A member 2